MLLVYEGVLGYVLHCLGAGRLEETPNKQVSSYCLVLLGMEERQSLTPFHLSSNGFPTSVVFHLSGGQGHSLVAAVLLTLKMPWTLVRTCFYTSARHI